MQHLVIISLLTSFSLGSIAQHQPEIFHPETISKDGAFGFTLSPNGREAFWVRSNGGRDTLIIMESHLTNNKWETPRIASFSGQKGIWKDIDPVFTPDGKKILFQSNRPVEGGIIKRDFDIWAVDKTNDGWSIPYHLGNVINSESSESFASMANNGNIYFMKENPNGVGLSDIYVSKFNNGNYQVPINIGHPINTNFRESNPYISPNEDYLIYFSSDSTGFGDVDLYISLKNNEVWSAPENLGQPLNSTLGEFCPFVHQQLKRIYFSRTVQQKNGRRIENIYSFPFDPEDYRVKHKK